MAVAQPLSAEPLAVFAESVQASGLEHLPSGYGDARMLANLVLHQVEATLPSPFARWVDDYRLFLSSQDDPLEHLHHLRRALAKIGLSLADEKVQISNEATGHDELASVYHPEYETAKQVRAALRTLFAKSTEDPVKYRQALRFVLPRLAEQEDDVAVDFALINLRRLPWDAPRLTHYLAPFVGYPHVKEAVIGELRAATHRGDIWLIARLLPLVCRTTNSRGLEEYAEALLEVTSSFPPAWGLAVRALALNRCGSAENATVQCGLPDPRAALAARADLGVQLDCHAAESAPDTAGLLAETGRANLPRIDGIL